MATNLNDTQNIIEAATQNDEAVSLNYTQGVVEYVDHRTVDLDYTQGIIEVAYHRRSIKGLTFTGPAEHRFSI